MMVAISPRGSHWGAFKAMLYCGLLGWSTGCADNTYKWTSLPLTSMVVTGAVAHCQSAYIPIVKFGLPCDDMDSHEIEKAVFTYYIEITGLNENEKEVLFSGPAVSLNAKQWANSWNLGFGTVLDKWLFVHNGGTYYPSDLPGKSIMSLASKCDGKLRMAVGYILHQPVKGCGSINRVWASGKSEFIIMVSEAPELETIIEWKRRGDWGAIELPNGRGMLFPLSTQAIKEADNLGQP